MNIAAKKFQILALIISVIALIAGIIGICLASVNKTCFWRDIAPDNFLAENVSEIKVCSDYPEAIIINDADDFATIFDLIKNSVYVKAAFPKVDGVTALRFSMKNGDSVNITGVRGLISIDGKAYKTDADLSSVVDKICEKYI